ncbi:MAG: hypothetical protein OEM26_04645 [Saprospiraceae bacterium]|nr:hypothetical protein [Saprospiraceae bacterium]
MQRICYGPSLMSTVDSLFNSLSTLWSVDIMKGWLRPDRTDQEMVSDGRKMIIATLFTGVFMGWILTYTKFGNPGIAFTHTLNELRYYVNCGIVVLIVAAVFLVVRNSRWVLIAFLATGPLHILFQYANPAGNYFVRSMWVILIALAIAASFNFISYHRTYQTEVFQFASREIRLLGWLMLISLGLFPFIWS